ncbi:MAG: hypothetical protein ABEK16_02910 [Candidatus Nanohalobium sp.]
MAKTKIPLLIAALALFTFSGASLSFNVEVDTITNYTIRGLDYRENVSTLQEINATVENTGSIGCTYRLKAEIHRPNKTLQRYSEAKPVWPGSSAFEEIHYVPLNYTGNNTVELKIQYCGQEEKIAEFNYTDTNNSLTNSTFSAEVRKLSKDSAEIKTRVQKGLLVPHQAPPYWKTSSVEIKKGEATLEYDAPIFQKQEQLSYIAVNQSTGELKGLIEVKLDEPRPTLLDKIMRKKLQLLISILLISLTVNTILIHERHTD